MEQRWTAPLSSRLGAVLAGGSSAAIGCGLIITAVVVEGPIVARVLIALVMLPIAVLSARVVLRAPRAVVSVSPRGIDIVGLLRSRHVSTAEVDRFMVSTFSTSCEFLVPVQDRRFRGARHRACAEAELAGVVRTRTSASRGSSCRATRPTR